MKTAGVRKKRREWKSWSEAALRGHANKGELATPKNPSADLLDRARPSESPKQPVPGSEYLTLNELAGRFGVSKTTLRRWITSGMPCYRIGRVVRVKLSNFEDWLAQFGTSGVTSGEHARKAWDLAMMEVGSED